MILYVLLRISLLLNVRGILLVVFRIPVLVPLPLKFSVRFLGH